MRVMILGSGAREHALAWKISQSPLCTSLICAPGNPGTASLAQNRTLNLNHPAEVVALARAEKTDLVVVGPEAPLVAGVADALRQAGISVFGPNQAAARLEASKAFSKEIMAEAGVPTAASRTFHDAEAAKTYARTLPRVVVKADGLAAGKGVVVAQSSAEAVAAIDTLRGLGEAAATFVLEEVLEGEEVSLIALCDGERYVLLPPAQDHKRVREGDLSPNTGGMGAYAPTPFLPRDQWEAVGQAVIAPILSTMRRRGAPFSGALFAGLMLTPNGVRVLEYNCRMGDPETQPLMHQLEEDLLPLLSQCAEGKLEARPLKLRAGVSVGVVVAAEGYPESPKLGDPVEGLEALAPGAVFHAGTSLRDGRLVSCGGRVVTVCGHGPSLEEAREIAYQRAERIRLRGAHFRRDIGAKALGMGMSRA